MNLIDWLARLVRAAAHLAYRYRYCGKHHAMTTSTRQDALLAVEARARFNRTITGEFTTLSALLDGPPPITAPDVHEDLHYELPQPPRLIYPAPVQDRALAGASR